MVVYVLRHERWSYAEGLRDEVAECMKGVEGERGGLEALHGVLADMANKKN